MNKVIILTNFDSISGRALLKECIKQNIVIEEVILIKQNYKYYFKLFNFVKNRVGFFQSLIFSISKLLFDFLHENLYCKIEKIEKIILTNSIKYKIFNTQSNWQNQVSEYIDLKESKLILLGQIGILGTSFELNRNDRLFLNCHPGKLPDYRGIDSFKWAIYKKDLDGFESTVHIVREKIDSGEKLGFEKYDFKKIKWMFSDRELLIISGKFLAKFVKFLMHNEENLIEEILQKGQKQELKFLNFKMNIFLEINSFLKFISLKNKLF